MGTESSGSANESELEVLQDIIGRLREGVVVIDDRTHPLLSNDGARRILGFRGKPKPAAAWIPEYCLSRLDGGPLKPSRSAWARALRGESIRDFRMVVGNPGQERSRVITVDAEPLPLKAGAPAGAIVILRDVSSAYGSTAADACSCMAIEYRQLVHALHEGLWACDESGTTIFVNETLASMLGCRPDDMIGQPIFGYFAEERRSACRKHLERRRRGITEDYETELIARDGRRVFVIIQASPILDPESRFIGSLAGVLDITARRESRRILESEQERLEVLVKERTAKLRKALDEVHALKDQLESENVSLREQFGKPSREPEIIGSSPALERVREQIAQVAPTESTVFLHGETGTGKGLLAEATHRQSHLADRPFVTVDCATLPPSLIESELFGHEKGAFTDAKTSRAGRFELADGGTVFLDEIGELSREVQARLLRFLQSGEFERLGSTETRKVHVRIICATNRNLRTMVADGSFRSDLFFRLNVFPIQVPPLRERLEDIRELVDHFIAKNAPDDRELGWQAAPDALRLLHEHAWPGNIRELENVVKRLVIFADGPRIETKHLKRALNYEILEGTDGQKLPRPKSVRENERRFLLDALRRSGWKIKGRGNAAELAGLAPSTFRDRMAKLGIRRKKAAGPSSMGREASDQRPSLPGVARSRPGGG